MAVHRVTRVLPYRPDQLAQLVADVGAYPDFVPWVSSMRTWNARNEGDISKLDAEAHVGFAFLKERFSTWVKHDRARHVVEVGLLRGPFRHLKNRWEFHDHPEGCRVEFMIDFAFKTRLLDAMLHANFDRAVGRLMGCFEARAKALYGPAAV
ncbi:type II toxin-antitoxin system RatA family toxin [Brevundimonas lutea]|uniref:type II toxin-antitoxin system RatA family toxin n=1 Tax=Brevundimonas lutea TaxID=2293980 RepID=UPI000F028FAC|nr:type II toxin-antitoxin system RatA family toxin [Brevundimonas lutea]